MTNNDLTELVFILDRSGSMAGLASDTIGGFNAMLAKQKAEPGQALVTTVLFDHETVTIHDRLKIAQVPEMTAREYSVRGSTALLDAVGRTKRKTKGGKGLSPPSTGTSGPRTCRGGPW